ncbi:MAG: HigA family addiction module antitoxin [bacterium]
MEDIPQENNSPFEPFKREKTIERKNDPNREPVHPGRILADYMEADGWNQSDLAETMDVSRDRINKIVNRKRGISHETAIKLSIVFENTEPDFWLGLDNARRLWEERQEKADEFKQLEERLHHSA